MYSHIRLFKAQYSIPNDLLCSKPSLLAFQISRPVDEIAREFAVFAQTWNAGLGSRTWRFR